MLYTVKKIGWISLRGTELIEGPLTHVTHVVTVCPLPCITKGYLQMVAGQMNLYRRHLGDVAGTKFHENYPSPSTSDTEMKGAKFSPSHAKKEKLGFYYIWGYFTWLKSALNGEFYLYRHLNPDLKLKNENTFQCKLSYRVLQYNK